MDFVELEIVNWSRYNPRKDIKNPTWFALSNRILEDPMFSEFTDAEFKAWIYILSQASLSNSSVIKLFFKHAQRTCAVSRQSLLSTITKLEIAETIQRRVQIANANVHKRTATIHNTTEHNTTKHNIAHADAFAEFWSKYPRKVGKGKAHKAWVREIASGAKPEDLLAARDRYRQHCESEKTEARFIKHGSTFMSEWRDWLDPETGSAEDFSAPAQIYDWNEITGGAK